MNIYIYTHREKYTRVCAREEGILRLRARVPGTGSTATRTSRYFVARARRRREEVNFFDLREEENPRITVTYL